MALKFESGCSMPDCDGAGGCEEALTLPLGAWSHDGLRARQPPHSAATKCRDYTSQPRLKNNRYEGVILHLHIPGTIPGRVPGVPGSAKRRVFNRGHDNIIAKVRAGALQCRSGTVRGDWCTSVSSDDMSSSRADILLSMWVRLAPSSPGAERPAPRGARQEH